jgi:hypothetical protein
MLISRPLAPSRIRLGVIWGTGLLPINSSSGAILAMGRQVAMAGFHRAEPPGLNSSNGRIGAHGSPLSVDSNEWDLWGSRAGVRSLASGELGAAHRAFEQGFDGLQLIAKPDQGLGLHDLQLIAGTLPSPIAAERPTHPRRGRRKRQERAFLRRFRISRLCSRAAVSIWA